MTALSPNFTLSEFTASRTADRLGIDNSPTPEQVGALRALVTGVLQPLRDLLGRAVHIRSGVRSPALLAALIENARQSGGPMPSRRSQHLKGEAADIAVDGLTPRDLALVIWTLHRAGIIEVDQCIWYANGSLVHVSFKSGRCRGEFLHSPKPGAYVPWEP